MSNLLHRDWSEAIERAKSGQRELWKRGGSINFFLLSLLALSLFLSLPREEKSSREQEKSRRRLAPASELRPRLFVFKFR
jgi:hypothetical protein